MGELKIRFCWITSHADRTEHAVSDDAQEASRTGVFEALCGAEFLAAFMDVGPDLRCPRCAAYLRARTTLRGLDERMVTARRRPWMSWLPCVARSRGRHSA